MNLKSLSAYLTEILQPEKFNDYCPNGLQIEGKSEVNKIVTGVTASQALLEAAIAAKADAILVHHGYFWKGESLPIVGMKKRRIQTLLTHDLSLLAYHLPLDAHPLYGNNVMLGNHLGLAVTRWLDDRHMIAVSDLVAPMPISVLLANIQQKLNRVPQLIGSAERTVTSVAWCTGAAQQYIEQVIGHAVDIFISGEVSEQTVHAVRESHTMYIAAGHHATERYGVQALGNHLAATFNIEHEYIEIENPV